MKKILIILLLLGTSCEGEPEPKTVSLGEPFSLAYGESVLVAGEEIEVEFEAVLEDGRCPTDLKCVWEGLARIRLGLSGVLVGGVLWLLCDVGAFGVFWPRDLIQPQCRSLREEAAGIGVMAIAPVLPVVVGGELVGG